MTALEELEKMPLSEAIRVLSNAWDAPKLEVSTEDLFEFLKRHIKEFPSNLASTFHRMFGKLPDDLKGQLPFEEVKRVAKDDDGGTISFAFIPAFEEQVLLENRHKPDELLRLLRDYMDRKLTPAGIDLAVELIKENIASGNVKIVDRWGNRTDVIKRLNQLALAGDIPMEQVIDIFKTKDPEGFKNYEMYNAQKVPAKTNWVSLSKHLYKLRKIIKLTPDGKITVRELNSTPEGKRIAQALTPFIASTGGKPITLAMIDDFESKGEQFDVEKSLWVYQNYQRSRYPQDKGPHQFLLHVKLNNKLRQQLEDTGVMAVFKRNEAYWLNKGEPSVPNQIGWARLELDPDKKIILVDEVQSFQRQVSKMMKTKKTTGASTGIYRDLEGEFAGTREEFNTYIENANLKIYNILKDFPNIMLKALNDFATENGYEKIYWHEYKSGTNLKLKEPVDKIKEEDRPPRVMYEEFPKENYFEDTEDQPFGLNGKFFKRDAFRYYRAARLLLRASKSFN